MLSLVQVSIIGCRMVSSSERLMLFSSAIICMVSTWALLTSSLILACCCWIKTYNIPTFVSLATIQLVIKRYILLKLREILQLHRVKIVLNYGSDYTPQKLQNAKLLFSEIYMLPIRLFVNFCRKSISGCYSKTSQSV